MKRPVGREGQAVIYFYVLRDFLRDCTYGAARGVFLDPIFLACLAIMPKCLAAPVPVGVVEWGRVILARFKLQLSSFTFSTSFPLPRTKKCSLVITSSPSLPSLSRQSLRFLGFTVFAYLVHHITI